MAPRSWKGPSWLPGSNLSFQLYRMKRVYPESYIDSGAKSGLELRSANTYPGTPRYSV